MTSEAKRRARPGKKGARRVVAPEKTAPAPAYPRALAEVPDRALGWLGPALIASAGLAMLLWTWRAWPDVLVDFGRELYVPWRLSEGQVLYRDLAYLNGPLSPYWNSLWFRVAGASFLTLVCANLVMLAVLASLLYAILSRIGGRLAATIAGLVFFPLFAFGELGPKANYTFVAPYSHDLTHGVVLSLVGIFCVQRYQDRRRSAWVAAAGLALGLLFLTKVEVFVAGALATLVGLLLALWRERPGRARLLELAIAFAAGVGTPIAVTFALFASVMPVAQVLQGPLGHWLTVSRSEVVSLLFYREGLGTSDIGLSISALLRSTAWYGAVLGPAAAVALALRTPGPHRLAMAAALFIATTVVIGVQWWRIVWADAARPLPLAMTALGATWAVPLVLRRRAETDDRIVLRLSMVVFAMALLVKMILNARIYHYGFALAMPATLMLVVALIEWVPAAIDRRGGYGRAFRAVGLAALLVAVLSHLHHTHRELSSRTVSVGDGPDAFLADSRGAFIVQALRDLSSRSGPGRTLAVLPEGVMINFLARRPNPTPYFVFVPLEVALYGEERIIAAFAANPPDYVMLVHRDTSEYGVQYFGRDYAQRLYEWIRTNYRPVAEIGAPPLQDGRFGIRLMQRNDLRP